VTDVPAGPDHPVGSDLHPNREVIGETVTAFTDAHPPRTDSPEYLASRRHLMATQRGGCLVCGGIPDLSHPELTAVGSDRGMQDHHGGGLVVKDVLVALNLFPIEWSQGWGSSPSVLRQLVANLNVVLAALGEPTYDAPITDQASVMAYVDSTWNANIRFCAPHHVGTQTHHSADANGHEAVGIHNIPGPIFWGQLTCDWPNFDMWLGTTGTLAGAPSPSGDGSVVVLHADPGHPGGLRAGSVLPPGHPSARAAFAGFRATPRATSPSSSLANPSEARP